ncbi:MAG: IS5 family transposase [Phycisphaerales bacterium]|nr:IS5 family transposase [Phycisphaerales bacterium]
MDWLTERIPDHQPSPKGGRPALDKRRAMQGIFWILDNGAKWKDLPKRFGSKSAVHRWFKRWVEDGVFENIMRDAGRLVEERDGYRLYECFIDATFSKAKGGGDGIGCTRAGKGVKIMVLVDARGLPVAVDTASASPHESQLVQRLFDFMLTNDAPERIVGDKAYDSDGLDAELDAAGIELIAPHRRDRKKKHKTQDGRSLRRYKRRWTVERTIGWIQHFRRLCIRWEKSTLMFQGFLHIGCTLLLLKEVLG